MSIVIDVIRAKLDRIRHSGNTLTQDDIQEICELDDEMTYYQRGSTREDERPDSTAPPVDLATPSR